MIILYTSEALTSSKKKNTLANWSLQNHVMLATSHQSIILAILANHIQGSMNTMSFVFMRRFRRFNPIHFWIHQRRFESSNEVFQTTQMWSSNLWGCLTTYLLCYELVEICISHHTLVTALQRQWLVEILQKCEFGCTQEGRNRCHSSLVRWTTSSRTWGVVFWLPTTQLIPT